MSEYSDAIENYSDSLTVKLEKLEAENKALKEENENLKLTAEIFKTESEIKDIFKTENKALKERDWEECCEEVKAALREEIEILKQSRDKLLEFAQSVHNCTKHKKTFPNQYYKELSFDVIQKAQALKDNEQH